MGRLRRGGFAHLTREVSTYLLDLLAVGAVYFVLAKIGLTLASINSSASPIWPATGFALAAVLMWGYRVAPHGGDDAEAVAVLEHCHDSGPSRVPGMTGVG